MASKILSKQQRVGILRQQTSTGAATAFAAAASNNNNWLDPGVAGSNYRTLYYDAGSINFDPGVQIDQWNPTSQNGIQREVGRRDVDAYANLSMLSFTGKADKNTLKSHLFAALQAGTEGGSTPYQAALIMAGLTGVVDFRGNSGYLHTIAYDRKGSADDGILLKNAILDSFTFEIDFNGQGLARKANISGTWKGASYAVDQTLSGTWATTTPVFYNNTDIFSLGAGFLIDGVDYSAECVRKFSVTINNSVSSSCRSGTTFNQFDITPMITAQLILDHNSATEKILGDFIANSAITLQFANDIASGTNGHLAFASVNSGAKLMTNPSIYNGEFVGIQLDIGIYAAGASNGFTVDMADALDWGY